MLAMDMGCPPAMFTVAATQTYGILAADLAGSSVSSWLEIDVALERVLVRGVVRFVDDHVDERPAGQFLVQPRGGEVHVAGHRCRPA